MAVSTVTALPKSQPDVSKLNTFTGYVVTVTKHLGPRGTVGTGIISSKVMTKEALLALPDQLPSLPGGGPGYYNFSVADAGGTGDDTWLVKLGPDIPQQQEYAMAGPMNGAPQNGFSGAAAPGVPSVPMDTNAVTQILPGWFYNASMALLYTPWRETVSWNQGDPLPKAPAAAAQASFTPPAATPWGVAPGSQWGGYPVSDSSSKEVEGLKAIIAEQKREREMSDLRADQRRQQDETNKRIDEQARMTREMFEKLADALTKKPSGPSDELLAIRAQNEKLERQLEQDRRDAQAREAAAATREEMRRMKDDTDRMIQTLTANKSDPMLTMMMQMMSQSNASAMEAVKAIQASTSTANTSAERQVASLVEQMRGTIISPIQMMEMMRSSRGDGAEMSKMVLETTKEMNTLQRNVFEQLLDASSGGSQPPWLTAVQALADKVGPIGEALANRAKQPQVVERIVRVPVQMPAQMNGAQAQQRVAAPQAPAALVDGASRMPEPIVVPTEVVRGKMPEPIITPVGPAPMVVAAAKKKSRKAKDKTDPSKWTIKDIGEMEPDDVAEAIRPFGDEIFFGPMLLPHIMELRGSVANGMTAEAAAEVLLKSRPQLQLITPIPGAVELFLAEQIEVLIERVLPDVDDDYRDKVVEIIEAQIDAEANGEDD